jgi:hypothetical protein
MESISVIYSYPYLSSFPLFILPETSLPFLGIISLENKLPEHKKP